MFLSIIFFDFEKHNIIPKNKIQQIINVFIRKRILDHYPLLIEKLESMKEVVNNDYHLAR